VRAIEIKTPPGNGTKAVGGKRSES
jgi:hypothetical protein